MNKYLEIKFRTDGCVETDAHEANSFNEIFEKYQFDFKVQYQEYDYSSYDGIHKQTYPSDYPDEHPFNRNSFPNPTKDSVSFFKEKDGDLYVFALVAKDGIPIDGVAILNTVFKTLLYAKAMIDAGKKIFPWNKDKSDEEKAKEHG